MMVAGPESLSDVVVAVGLRVLSDRDSVVESVDGVAGVVDDVGELGDQLIRFGDRSVEPRVVLGTGRGAGAVEGSHEEVVGVLVVLAARALDLGQVLTHLRDIGLRSCDVVVHSVICHEFWLPFLN